VLGPTKGTLITFGPGSGVRARPDVVLGPDSNGAYEARVALLDDLPLSRAAVEMIALPIVEHVSLNLAGAPTIVVRVWQLALQQEEDVLPSQAHAPAVRQAVQTLLANA
jgi:hypothetical protein